MQPLRVKWGESTSICFQIQMVRTRINLFGMYMSVLTDELYIYMYAGCYINDKCINHIMYEYIIYLMALTRTAVKNLLDVCHYYRTVNHIVSTPLK